MPAGGWAPRFAQALCYVAADYEPGWLQSPDHTFDWANGTGDERSSSGQDAILGIQRVKTEGLRAFRNVVGCILCNELIDNFPVHRFAIQGGRVKESSSHRWGGISPKSWTSILSSHRKEAEQLGLILTEGYRGEVNLAMEDWTAQLSRALDEGLFSLSTTVNWPLTSTHPRMPRVRWSVSIDTSSAATRTRTSGNRTLPARWTSRPSCGWVIGPV